MWRRCVYRFSFLWYFFCDRGYFFFGKISNTFDIDLSFLYYKFVMLNSARVAETAVLITERDLDRLSDIPSPNSLFIVQEADAAKNVVNVCLS